ncbi:hypothetical protein ACFXMT_33680 [Streptomyces mirabilis]|uniref:hypothetical protein n=1 Tax=Streptomyces mirabilis TaxID=68239 RepID=UPI00369C0D15
MKRLAAARQLPVPGGDLSYGHGIHVLAEGGSPHHAEIRDPIEFGITSEGQPTDSGWPSPRLLEASQQPRKQSTGGNPL